MPKLKLFILLLMLINLSWIYPKHIEGTYVGEELRDYGETRMKLILHADSTFDLEVVAKIDSVYGCRDSFHVHGHWDYKHHLLALGPDRGGRVRRLPVIHLRPSRRVRKSFEPFRNRHNDPEITYVRIRSSKKLTFYFDFDCGETHWQLEALKKS